MRYNLQHYTTIQNLFINGSIFCKVCDFPPNEIISEFREYIKKEHIELIKNFNDIYVIISEKYGGMMKTDILQWRNIMSDEQYRFLNKYNYYIIGYIFIEKEDINDQYIYIKHINSRIKSLDYNISKYMIDKLKYIYRKEVIPQNISRNSKDYWKKLLPYIIDTIQTYEKYRHIIE